MTGLLQEERWTLTEVTGQRPTEANESQASWVADDRIVFCQSHVGHSPASGHVGRCSMKGQF
jgi:hypothetical protein